MEFESRVALEAEIDACSARVRELQEFMRKSDGGVTIEQVSRQVKQLVVLRKELQLWKAHEDGEQAQEAASNQRSNNDSGDAAAATPTSSIDGKKEREESNESSGADAEPALAGNNSSDGESVGGADEPVSVEAKEKIAEEWQHEDRATTGVDGAVGNQTEEDESARPSSSPSAAADANGSAGLPRAPAAALAPTVDSTTAVAADALLQRADALAQWLMDSNTELSALEDSLKKAQLTKQASEYLASRTAAEVAVVKETAETASAKVAKRTASSKREERTAGADVGATDATLLAKIAELEQPLAEEKTRGTEAKTASSSVNAQQLAMIAHLEQQVVDTKVEIAGAQQVNAALVDAENKLRDEQERLLASVADLQEANAELTKKIEDAATSDVQLRHELTELQLLLKQTGDAKLENDTNFRKLWKTIDELQIANDKLQKKNTQLEADTKLARAEAEEAAKELSAHRTRAEDLASELAAAQSVPSAPASQRQTLTAQVQQLSAENAVLLEKLAAVESELEQSKQDAASATVPKNASLMLAIEEMPEQVPESLIQGTLELSARQEAQAGAVAGLELTDGRHADLATEMQNLRALVASKETMLKKARSSMLEANEELKSAYKSVAKWKSSAQTASTQLSEKTAEVVTVKKQLAKIRTELAAAESARKQMSVSLKEKDRKISKAAHEAQLLKKELEALETEMSALKHASAALDATLDATVAELTNANAELAKSSLMVPIYHQVCLGLVSLLITATFCAANK